jgi:hypothetical protein
VHPQHIGPQLFVTEGVVAENGLPISMFPFGIVSIVPFAIVVRATSSLACGYYRSEPCDGERQRESEYD